MDQTIEKKTLKDKFFVWATKFANNRTIHIIANGFSRLLPITMIGTLVSLITIVDNYTNLLKNANLLQYVTLGDTMTNGIISIFLVAAMAYEMAKGIKKSPIAAILISLVCFFILTPMTSFTVKDSTVSAFTTTYLGSKGMFVGMVTALLATKLFAVFMDKGIKIKMPAEVPSAISESIASVFAFASVAFIFIIINGIFASTSFGSAHGFVYAILQKPLEGASDSIWTMLIIACLGELLWFFGIHGSNATSAITNTLYLPLSIANAQALAVGTSLPYILNSYFLVIWKCPTRHFIMAALLLWACKSKQLKAIGKVAIVPGFFGISEPMKYGIPMVFNPILLIPMVITPMISLVIAYVATVIGFLPRVGLNLPWYIPFPINGIMAGGWAGLVVEIIQCAVVVAIYFPFVKLLDKQKCAEEAEKEKQAAESLDK
jgi:PTS system, lactose/cellobiose family IIC component